MKKLLAVFLLFLMVGCASGNKDVGYDYASDPRYPPGKTDVDWELDEAECLKLSGKWTGFLGGTIPGIIVNVGGANSRYNECMKEKGWYK